MGKGGDFERQISKELSMWASNGKADDIFWRSSQSGGRATTRAKSNIKTANSAGDISFTDPVGKPFLDMFVLELKNGYGGKNKLRKKEIKNLVSDLVHYNTSSKKEQKNIVSKIKKSMTKKQCQAWDKKKGGFDYDEYINLMIFKEVERSKDDGKISVLDILDSNLKNKILISWAEKAQSEAIFHDKPFWMLIFKRNNRRKCVMSTSDAINTLCTIQYDETIFDKKFIKINTVSSGIKDLEIFDYVDFFKWLKFDTIKHMAKRYTK